MTGITDWARDTLLARGALVEVDPDGALRAMLSPKVATALGSSEWLSLRFGAGAGADDENEWLERLGRLLPADARVTGARLRRPIVSRPIDAEAVLDRELVIQNGIYRPMGNVARMAWYYFFAFQYTIESDETRLGICTQCLNASVRSLVERPERLLQAFEDNLEEDPGFVSEAGRLKELFPQALRMAQPEIRRVAEGVEFHANRRLARDAERIDGYYADLQRQIAKRVARHAGDTVAEEKERSRAAATELDHKAKLEDLTRKYSLKIRVEAGDVLIIPLPVQELSVRLIRKKADRVASLDWNPALGALEYPWCEGCLGRAYPLLLCDDRVHTICKSCLGPCRSCGRVFCRACQKKCKCGYGS
jgi:hypothetical protein